MTLIRTDAEYGEANHLGADPSGPSAPLASPGVLRSPTGPLSAALSPPRLSAAEHEAMARLKALLEARSWQQLHLHIAGGGTFAPDYARAAARVFELGGSDSRLLALLGLGLPVADQGLEADERVLYGALAGAGLLAHESGALQTRGWVVAPAFGGQVLMGIPSTYTQHELVGALAYLGTDSLLLAKLLGPVAGRRVLDLGAGCGAQGLLATRGASEAVLTDIDPFSMRISALNWALNDVAHPVLLGEGDLFAPVAGETFDVITVLPPYVPTVPTSGVSITAAGGADGLAFIRRLLRGTEAVLRPGGELVALAQLLCDDEGPLLARELPSIAPGLQAQLVLVDRHPLQPYITELAQRLVAHGQSASLGELVAHLDTSLRALGATGVCTAALRLRRGAGLPVRVIGPSGHLEAREVLALSPGVALATPEATPRLALPGGGFRLLDPVTAALLGAIDGRRNLAELVSAGWGRPQGARPEQLLEQAMLRLEELVGAGLLERRIHNTFR